MKTARPTTEPFLYLLAFLLALSVRLLALGDAPLNSYEARWALDALDLARSQAGAGSAHPGYVALTGLAFTILGSSSFLARFLPAVGGALLTLAPYFVRNRVGRSPAILFAFLIALDPGLTAVSRQAGSPILALSFITLAMVFLASRRLPAAGIFAGLALLSGPFFWHGLLVLALTWGLVRLAETAGWITPLSFAREDSREGAGRGFIPFAAYLVGTFLLVGTLFMLYPQGLGGFATSFPEYLRSWSARSGISALQIPAGLLVYQPLGVLLGLIGAVRAWVRRDPEDASAQRLSLVFLAALITAVVMPGRQVDDLVWALFPLLGMAAIELHRRFTPFLRGQNLAIASAQAALIVLIFAFSWNYITFLAGSQIDQGPIVLQNLVFLTIGTLSMTAVVVLVAALGWGLHTAGRGLAWGLIAVLSVYGFSTLWGSMELSANPRWEMWGRSSAASQKDQMLTTLTGFSAWDTGLHTSVDVVSLADSPTLRWTLRNWEDARFLSGLEAGTQPSILITYAGQESPETAAAYTGQDFVLEEAPIWNEIIPSGFVRTLRWLVYRQAPTTTTSVILWVRTDLFLGAANSASASP